MQLSQVLSTLFVVLSPIVGANIASQLGYGLLGKVLGGVIAFIVANVVVVATFFTLFIIASVSEWFEKRQKINETVEPESRKKD